MNKVYKTMVQLSRLHALIIAILVTILCLVVIWFGYKHMDDKKFFISQVQGTIISSGKDKSIVEYTINGIRYQQQIDAIGPIGSTITLYYNPSDPNRVEILLLSPRSEYLIIGVCFIVLFLIWGIFLLNDSFIKNLK